MSEHEDGYAGAATLLVAGAEAGAEVELRGHFQPIDGYYHWYGRVKASERVSELAAGRKRRVEIRTPEGSAGASSRTPTRGTATASRAPARRRSVVSVQRG